MKTLVATYKSFVLTRKPCFFVNSDFWVCPFVGLTRHYCRLAGNLSALTDSQRPTESHTTVNCLYCSSLPYVDCVYELCKCVCMYPCTCDRLLSPLIITSRVSQALARRVRVGIKQQNNGELPPLNLLMGFQWLPWLLPNYQPLDSLTSLHQLGCVCGGSE